MNTYLLRDQMPPAALSPGLALPVDYRTLPRVSNSDLTRLKEEQLGYQSGQRTPQAAGKAFHQHLLQPTSVGAVLEQLLPDLTNDRLLSAGSYTPLPEAVRRDPFCRRYLRLAERERIVLFTDPVTQVACKTRLDLVHTSPKRQNVLVFDFKTTSARTQSQFLQSCYDYDYDRQAAFYLDSLRYADRREWATTQRFQFVFIGVANEQPGRLFAVDATSLPNFVEYGRKKYRFWLKKWRETNGLPD